MDADDGNDSMSNTSSERDNAERSRRNSYLMTIITTLAAAITHYASGLYDKQSYHTSALTGHAWVLELLTGHPDRIRCELGVRHHVFHLLLDKLRELGHTDSRHVTLEEQLSIFLYSCVTGLSTRHVGERFQRANDTISRYV